jgi:hypothetical protein
MNRVFVLILLVCATHVPALAQGSKTSAEVSENKRGSAAVSIQALLGVRPPHSKETPKLKLHE